MKKKNLTDVSNKNAKQNRLIVALVGICLVIFLLGMYGAARLYLQGNSDVAEQAKLDEKKASVSPCVTEMPKDNFSRTLIEQMGTILDVSTVITSDTSCAYLDLNQNQTIETIRFELSNQKLFVNEKSIDLSQYTDFCASEKEIYAFAINEEKICIALVNSEDYYHPITGIFGYDEEKGVQYAGKLQCNAKYMENNAISENAFSIHTYDAGKYYITNYVFTDANKIEIDANCPETYYFDAYIDDINNSSIMFDLVEYLDKTRDKERIEQLQIDTSVWDGDTSLYNVAKDIEKMKVSSDCIFQLLKYNEDGTKYEVQNVSLDEFKKHVKSSPEDLYTFTVSENKIVNIKLDN